MEGARRHLPAALRVRMNTDGEVETFQSFMRQCSDLTLASSAVVQSTYEEKTSQFVRIADNTGLRAALQRYLDDDPKADFWQTFDAETCSWDQVFEELNNAEEVYKGKGKMNPIRRVFRHGAGFSRTLRPLVDGIPQDNGLGLLRGGLQVIFNAVQKRGETCERVFETFKSIPQATRRAESLHEIYPQDEALAAALTDINKISQFGKTVFGDSLRDLNIILKPLEDAEKRLNQCQDMLDTRGIAATRHISEETVQKVTSVQQVAESNGNKLDLVGAALVVMSSKFSSWEQREQQERAVHLEDNKVHDIIQQMTSVFQMYHEKMATCPASDRAHSSKISRYTRAKFMDYICNEEERLSSTRDLGLVLRKYHDFSTKILAQASYLLTTPRFQSWLTGPFSDIVLVDGHCSESVGKVAPTSVFCAGFIESHSVQKQESKSQALVQQPDAILSFFAGEHVTASSGLCGPFGLVRSLVDQLLFYWPGPDLPDLSFLERSFMQLAEEGQLDIQDFCDIFEELLSRLDPNSEIWCVIDGISFFETTLHGWKDDMAIIIDSFIRCVTDAATARNRAGSVKFLLVSPVKSATTRDVIHGNSRIELRAGNYHY
ncbi:hypothetical protein ACHAP7_008171 [Fusarium lateritium]